MGKRRTIVARRIEQIRKAAGLSRQDLADRVGTSYLQIYRIEKGITAVAVEAAAAFAKALGVDIAALYQTNRRAA